MACYAKLRSAIVVLVRAAMQGQGRRAIPYHYATALPKRRPGERKGFAGLSLSPFLNALETRAANLRLVRRGSHWRERLCA